MLDTPTIHVVVGLVSVISTMVMVALWRINRRLPGVAWWMAGSVCSTVGFCLVAYQSWAPEATARDAMVAAGHALDLAALLLLLEGTLRFRKALSPTRWRWLLALTAVLALLAWTLQGRVVQSLLVHDLLAVVMLMTMAFLFVWRTSRHEIVAHGLASFFLAVTALGLGVRWVLAVGSTGDAALQAHPLTTVVGLVGIVFAMGWTYSVSVACYYRSQNTILRVARQDALTHLPNRRDVDETLQRAIGQAARTGAAFGWIVMDLNGFKPVNDQHGHAVGDALLVEVAQRLKKFCRESDFAGRLGGDEFVVLVHGTENTEQLRAAMQRLARCINGPAIVAGVDLRIDASMGAALWPRDGRSARKLTMAADKRMYASKARRGAAR